MRKGLSSIRGYNNVGYSKSIVVETSGMMTNYNWRTLSGDKTKFSQRIYFTGVVLVLLSIIFFLWRTQSNPTAENLSLPLNSTDEFYSSNEYSGYVYLTISGSGQIASDVYIDAFYTFDSLDGLSSTENVRRNYGFEIDNKIADVLVIGNIPKYNSHHVYNDLSYYVGDTPRLISFRVADRDVSDNEGKLTISISAELPFQYSGR